MHQSDIHIKVTLDADKIPANIQWNASDSTAEEPQQAKAMMMAFWDGIDKSALRIDLWTKEMMVDEMADFYYQNLMSMADTFARATQHKELVEDMKAFAKSFYQKFREIQLQQNKLV
ncbi:MULTISPECIES: gliding motility protein GldC [unclassified Hydrotalea]|uniref:gliding motility protein GldC n=1 Tax=unclassified Hydrotalea TaxID=2643788 RepID=UPI0009BFC8D4|nr:MULTISPECIES: gliding motility protein GldC [unclassified Hydrotalea]RWZ88639.1 MAG: gliding motility protein GldC [Hydrotalea sp. AMD]